MFHLKHLLSIVHTRRLAILTCAREEKLHLFHSRSVHTFGLRVLYVQTRPIMGQHLSLFEALLGGQIDIAWNGPLAHVRSFAVSQRGVHSLFGRILTMELSIKLCAAF